MRHRHLLSSSLRTMAICLPCLVGGCGIYLHDSELQSRTEKTLADYRQADISGAMKAAIENQRKLNAAEIDALIAFDTADRENVLAKLVEPGSPLPSVGGTSDTPPLQRLTDNIERRRKDLIGEDTAFNPADWSNLRELMSIFDDQIRQRRNDVDASVRKYKRLGGTGFRSCDNFTPTGPLSPEAGQAAKELRFECGNLAATEFDPVPTSALAGEVGETRDRLAAVTEELRILRAARDAAYAELQEARDAVEAARGRQAPSQAAIQQALAKLDETLDRIDKASDFAGQDSASLGTALAAIEFRKTNLRALIAAGADPQPGGEGTDPAREIAAIISGLANLADLQAGRVPSIAMLSVALAAQDGVAKTARTALEGVTTQQNLLKEQEVAQLREIEMLALALDSARAVKGEPRAADCAAMSLGRILTTGACSLVQADAARALSAFNLSWSSGRRASFISDRKLSQLIRMQNLRLSLEAAEARRAVLEVAMSELAAFGAGGVKPETIAAFLQALGLTAVAVGVN